MAVDAWRRHRRAARARHTVAVNRRGRLGRECSRAGLRHDGIRTPSPRLGDTLGYDRPGCGEAGDAWAHPPRLFGARDAAGGCRGRRFGHHGDERGPERSRGGGWHPSGRCPGELGWQARKQAAAPAEIAGSRQRWKARDTGATPRRPAAAGDASDRRKARGLKEAHSKDRLRLAVDVADTALAERIATALSHAEGVELVGSDAEPDALVVAGPAGVQAGDGEIVLTPRELEVLALLAEGASNKLIARR